MQIVIVGGGIAGLSTAYALCRAGLPPTVLEARTLGQGATWAAAGMLAPIHELEPTELPLLAAGQASLALHHEWAAHLAAAGLGVGLRTEGTLEVALARDDIGYLRRQFDFMQRQGLPVEWLEGPALRAREPALAPGLPAAIWAPADVQVDNRRLVQALAEACRRAGARVLEHAPVQGWTAAGAQVLVHAAGHDFAADGLLLATGAAATPWPSPERTYPVRGQMLALAPGPGLPQHVVRIRSRAYGNAYLVPKADRVILGSTSEEMGHDPRLTAGGLLDILRKAYLAVPAVYDQPVLDTWAGLRPATRQRVPHLTRAAGAGAPVWHLNGLYRHGILLGPLLGTAAAAALTGQPLPAAAQPFLHVP